MRLNTFTDYSLRVLIFAAVRHPELSQISEIADSYRISTTHLTKVVHQLGRGGFLKTQRGRGGGIRLSRPAREISLGSVVRHSEKDLRLVECFEPSSGRCSIEPVCGLRPIFAEALEAFLQVLDSYSLEDLLAGRKALATLLTLELPSTAS